jgi:hypothetical protein
MNADLTARKVLAWAADPQGPPPTGPLTGVPELARPRAETLKAARSLLRSGAARLGAGSPPLGDALPAGGGVILLAAAVGGRGHGGPARRLAAAARPPRPAADGRWSDAVARHLVVAPARAAATSSAGLNSAAGASATAGRPAAAAPPGPAPPGQSASAPDEPLAEVLLRGSPLTCVLQRPPRARLREDRTAEEVGTAVALLRSGRGRSLLTRSLAAWDPDPEVLDWRAGLLDLLITEHDDVVVETYLLARTVYADEWDRRILEADHGLRGFTAGLDDRHLAAVRFWKPMERLLARRPDLLREHPYLDGCDLALRLVGRYRPTVRRPG